MKVFSWIATVFLILVLAGLVFVHFSADYNMYLVRSESMKPAIDAGDLVLIGPPGGPLGGEVSEGSVITYNYGSELITHRVIGINGDIIQTQGDAVEDPDPWSVQRSDVRGVYLFRLRGVGHFQNFVRTQTGWITVIIIPSGVLVGLLVREIRKKLRESSAAS